MIHIYDKVVQEFAEILFERLSVLNVCKVLTDRGVRVEEHQLEIGRMKKLSYPPEVYGDYILLCSVCYKSVNIPKTFIFVAAP